MADPQLKQVIENAAKSGKFGENLKFVDLVPSSEKGEDHFASQVIFAEVKLQNGSGDVCNKVVIKKQEENAFVREIMNTDLQFYNELLMYDELLPFINNNKILEEIVPKFICGCATLGEKYEEDILVIEDLRQFGYTLTEEKIFLDFDHCALALTKLGSFHALSYYKKQEDLEGFFSKLGKLKEVRWEDDQSGESNKFLSISIERGVQSLMEEGENVNVLEQFLEKLRDPHSFMQGLCRPEEPVAVLCHGDFCRNNMLFKYDEDGKPVDVRFFDVATARYASPAIDLAFFLFMNTSAVLRSYQWDDLLKVYHDSLSSTIPDCQVPSLDVIRKELSRKAIYGYVLCSFFIPMMLEVDHKMDVDEFMTLKPEEREEISKNRGGEQGTRYVTDIVRDLVRLNYL